MIFDTQNLKEKLIETARENPIATQMFGMLIVLALLPRDIGPYFFAPLVTVMCIYNFYLLKQSTGLSVWRTFVRCISFGRW